MGHWKDIGGRKILAMHTRAEGRKLFELARNCKGNGAIVEIGSWKGASTICLAQGSRANSCVPVYAVDPHNEGKMFREFKKNVEAAELSYLIKPLVMTSKQAAKSVIEPIELVFIDGDHSLEHVEEDFMLWFPKLMNGGTIAFHDALWHPKIERVVDKAIYKSNRFRNICMVDSLLVAKKCAGNSFFNRLLNRWALFYKWLYYFACRVNKLARREAVK